MPSRRNRLTLLRLSSVGVDHFLVAWFDVASSVLSRLSSFSVLPHLSRVGDFCDGGVDVDYSVLGVVRVAVAERARLGVRRREAARRRALGAVNLFSRSQAHLNMLPMLESILPLP